jgi:formate-dependent nitrite reductase membrane component NrfD
VAFSIILYLPRIEAIYLFGIAAVALALVIYYWLIGKAGRILHRQAQSPV